MKKSYVVPQVIVYGGMDTITGAIGGGGGDDQSDYPSMFPAGKGSYDVCNNNSPNSVC